MRRSESATKTSQRTGHTASTRAMQTAPECSSHVLDSSAPYFDMSLAPPAAEGAAADAADASATGAAAGVVAAAAGVGADGADMERMRSGLSEEMLVCE